LASGGKETGFQDAVAGNESVQETRFQAIGNRVFGRVWGGNERICSANLEPMDSQTPITPNVYAPNLHLFAFHLWRGLTGEIDSLAPNPKQLWERADQILEALNFKERLHIDGYPEKSSEPPGAQINLHPQNHLKLTGTLPNSDLTITGNIYTHRLYDSYSLTINFRRPEKENNEKTSEIPITFWQNLNQEKLIFLPSFLESSLGQTLLLTAFLLASDQEKTPEELENFASSCLEQVMPSSKTKQPPLVKKGELFGNPIFEFGGQVLDANLEEEPEVQPHVLILLFREESASDQLVDAYRQFINLFYYRNKVVSAYAETRTLYRKTYDAYVKLEKKVKTFKQELKNETLIALSQPQLENLKTALKELAISDLEYARLLRNYKHCRNTIVINTKNYEVALTEIVKTLQEKHDALQPKELDFFRDFSFSASPYFKSRINDELNYFVEGSTLADKAIASIRGIVEIEQTQRDRLLEQRIQIIGVGITAGAIVASTSPLIFDQPWTLPGQANQGESWHPFIVAIFLSVAASLGFSALTWLLLKLRKH